MALIFYNYSNLNGFNPVRMSKLDFSATIGKAKLS